MQLGQYQVIVGYLDDGKENLGKSLDFMLTAHDYKSSGMIYRYLGLIEINNQSWKGAQKYFIKALNYHQQSQHRAAFEFTTLFSIPAAIVKVLNTDPNSYTPRVILFV